VGRDRGYRGSRFLPVPALSPAEEPTVPLGADPDSVRRTADGAEWLLVVDGDHRPLGWVQPADLRGPVARDALHRGGTVARTDGSLRTVLDAALSSPSGRGVVVDGDGVLVGTVTPAQVVAAMAPAGRR
jgi:osmoprotectant transport system ATP-binding protein